MGIRVIRLLCEHARDALGPVTLLAASFLPGIAVPVIGGPLEPMTIASPLLLSDAEPEDDVTRLRFDDSTYELLQSSKNVVLADFILGENRQVDLALRRIDLFAAEARIVLGTPKGDVPLDRPDVVLLGGSILGKPDSVAFLALSPHGSNGIIRVGEETFIISSGRSGAARIPVVYELNSLPLDAIKWKNMTCAADELSVPGRQLVTDWGVVGESFNRHSRDGCGAARVARMAIETDWEFTGQLFGGDLEAASAYAATLLGAVSEIYKRDVDTALRVEFLRLWSSAGDPWDQGNTGDQLVQFRDYWNAHMTDVERHAAHFLSGRPLGGGIAYVGGLCSSWYDYAVSANLGGYFPYPLEDNHFQNWDPYVVAHELGHNFGAPHTHSTTPPIDNCAGGECGMIPNNGTIMSYCHTCPGGMVNIQLRFHERIANEHILPFLEGGSSCDFRPVQPQADVVTKNRYLSFAPRNAGLCAAFQVEILSSADFPDAVGSVWWVEAPDADGVSRLTSAPVYRDWTEPMIHIADCPVVPDADYGVRGIAAGWPIADPNSFCLAATVSTTPKPESKHWGDVVGEFTGTEWTGPNGVATMDDIMATVQKFQQPESAPHLTWVDVEPEVPNLVLNFTDIFQIVQGFKAAPYPFSDPAECP